MIWEGNLKLNLKLYMTPQQAFETMQKEGEKTIFVDVRTREEVNFLGMPTVADANIPYMKLNEWFAWNTKKKNFQMEPSISELIFPSLKNILNGAEN